MGRFRKLLVLSLSLLSLSLVSCILLKANPNCQMVSGIRVAHSKTQHLSIFRSLMLTCRSEPKSTKELLALKRVSLWCVNGFLCLLCILHRAVSFFRQIYRPMALSSKSKSFLFLRKCQDNLCNFNWCNIKFWLNWMLTVNAPERHRHINLWQVAVNQKICKFADQANLHVF